MARNNKCGPYKSINNSGNLPYNLDCESHQFNNDGLKPEASIRKAKTALSTPEHDRFHDILEREIFNSPASFISRKVLIYLIHIHNREESPESEVHFLTPTKADLEFSAALYEHLQAVQFLRNLKEKHEKAESSNERPKIMNDTEQQTCDLGAAISELQQMENVRCQVLREELRTDKPLLVKCVESQHLQDIQARIDSLSDNTEKNKSIEIEKTPSKYSRFLRSFRIVLVQLRKKFSERSDI